MAKKFVTDRVDGEAQLIEDFCRQFIEGTSDYDADAVKCAEMCLLLVHELRKVAQSSEMLWTVETVLIPAASLLKEEW